jgi:hypothetical protein
MVSKADQYRAITSDSIRVGVEKLKIMQAQAIFLIRQGSPNTTLLIAAAALNKLLTIVAYVATIKALIWIFTVGASADDLDLSFAYSLEKLTGSTPFVVTSLLVIFSFVFFCRRCQARLICSISANLLRKIARYDRLSEINVELLTVKMPIVFSQLSILFSSFIFFLVIVTFIAYLQPAFGLMVTIGSVLSIVAFSIRRRRNITRQGEIVTTASEVNIAKKETNSSPDRQKHFSESIFRLFSLRSDKWQEEYELVHLENLAIGLFIVLLIIVMSFTTVTVMSSWQLIFLAVGTKFTFGSARETAQSAAFFLNEQLAIDELTVALCR